MDRVLVGNGETGKWKSGRQMQERTDAQRLNPRLIINLPVLHVSVVRAKKCHKVFPPAFLWHRPFSLKRSLVLSLSLSLSLSPFLCLIPAFCITFYAPWAKCQLLSWRTRQKVCWNNVKHNLHTIFALPFFTHFFSSHSSCSVSVGGHYVCRSCQARTDTHSRSLTLAQCSFDTNLIYATLRTATVRRHSQSALNAMKLSSGQNKSVIQFAVRA